MSDLAMHGGTAVRTTPLPTVGEAAGRTLGTEEEEAVLRVLRSGQLNCTVGGETRAFEGDFAEYYGVEHCVASSSGTAALHLAVAAVNPNPGDEIITTPFTDAGTVLPIIAQNAVPVFADVDGNGLIDVGCVESLITPRTRAIIAVHLFGQPAPVAQLRELADRHSLVLIEDCAQAYLTRDGQGRLAGTVGHIGCFSLQQSKHIIAGDGGITITNDAALARRARLFADKAWPRDTDERTHLFFSLNYRMTELQAAVAREQLKKLEWVVTSRRRTAKQLTEVVKGLDGLRSADEEGNSYWLFPIFIDPQKAGGDAHDYAEALAAEGVPGMPGYIQNPLYLTPVISDRNTYGDSGYPFSSPPADTVPEYAPGLCPQAESLIGGNVIALGWNENYAEQDVADICEALTKVHAALSSR